MEESLFGFQRPILHNMTKDDVHSENVNPFVLMFEAVDTFMSLHVVAGLFFLIITLSM